MFNFDNGIFDDILGLLIFLVGISIFAILLISSIQNYNKNRSYSVGAIFILVFSPIRPLLFSSITIRNINLIEFLGMFLATFSFIVTVGLMFYFLMSCIRMVIEKMP